ncbi:MAG TPA: hypothetical protein VMW89_10530 [Desulfatiglandales bacterium]|nr:hypothetical protein [Desulfatiglandales bacterium]
MNQRENRELSPRAKAAYNQIDEITLKIIQKSNPLKGNRNQAIRELKAKGLNAEILAEISGLCRGSIFRVLKPKDDIPEYVKQEIAGLTGAFQSLLTALTRILGNTFQKGGEKALQAKQGKQD